MRSVRRSADRAGMDPALLATAERVAIVAVLCVVCTASTAACTAPPPPPTARAAAPPMVAASAAPSASVDAAPSVPPVAEPPMATCEDVRDVTVLASPEAPWKGAPLRVIIVSEKPVTGELSIVAPDGSRAAASRERHGGPPYWWMIEVPSPAAGTYKAKLAFDRTPAECSAIAKNIVILDGTPKPPKPTWGSVWPIHNEWNRASENLYSAWIEKLFDAPIDAQPSYSALHEVLRDRSKNFLFNHLGLGEDEAGLVIRPDCADLPYFLRAYFAFKMGLPFGYSSCSRGGGGAPPTCPGWAHNQDPIAAKRPGLTASFGYFLRWTVADAVHSGSGRAPAGDDKTDYYPVPLSADALRPGTIYADPYGHVLVLSKRIAQTPEAGGVFLAVDGQPDGTVARKRFWRGNFLFAIDPALGSPGFKRFRPVVQQKTDKSGALRRLTNDEIGKSAEYGDFSLEQSKVTVEAFYDKMDDVMSPSPLDPERAMREVIQALEEQVKTRVTSVENGRKFLASGRGSAEMPDGPSIFETTGAWEDFSTPSRDLRMLIAIDVAKGFADRVARRPERYAMPKDKSVADVKADLEATLARELAARTFTYTRSDGTPFTLSLADVVQRGPELEMAYNPNDCVELRWGAPDKSDEVSTCKRHASWAQHAKMARYREWFHERRRPARS